MSEDRGDLSIDEMGPDELDILSTLVAGHALGQGFMLVPEILSNLVGWNRPRFYNNLRRLMRHDWVHCPMAGAYALTEPETAPQVEPAAEVAIVHVERVVQLSERVELETKISKEIATELVDLIHRNPVELTEDQALMLRAAARSDNPEKLKLIQLIKRVDCSFYNACLDQAIEGDWHNFACINCTAYEMSDPFQRQLDVLALRACDKASEQLVELGKVNRTRGVKPGPDAKRTVTDDDDDEDEQAEAY